MTAADRTACGAQSETHVGDRDTYAEVVRTDIRRLEWAIGMRLLHLQRQIPHLDPATLLSLDLEHAWMLMAQCRFEKVVALAERLIESMQARSEPASEHYGEALLLLGMARLRQGIPEKARAPLEEASGMQCANAQLAVRCHQELGRTLQELEMPGEALRAFANAAISAGESDALPGGVVDGLRRDVAAAAQDAGFGEGVWALLQDLVSLACSGATEADISVLCAFTTCLSGVNVPGPTVDPNQGSARHPLHTALLERESRLSDLEVLDSLLDGPPDELEHHSEAILPAFDAATLLHSAPDELFTWINDVEERLDRADRFWLADSLWEHVAAWVDWAWGPWSSTTARVLSRLGSRLAYTGRLRTAERCKRRVIEIREHRQDDQYRLDDLMDLGRIQAQRGRHRDAVKSFAEAREGAASSERWAYLLRSALSWEARALSEIGEIGQAEEGFREIIRQQEERHPGDPTWTVTPSVDLALALVRGARVDEARALYDGCSWIPERLAQFAASSDEEQGGNKMPEEHWWYAAQRGRLAVALGLHDEAEQQLAAAISALIRCDGPRTIALARPLRWLSEALVGQGRPSDARNVLERALTIMRRLHYRTHPERRAMEQALAGLRSELEASVNTPADSCTRP